MAARSEDRFLPWELRLCDALPIPPLAIGAVAFAVATAASFLYFAFVSGSIIPKTLPAGSAA